MSSYEEYLERFQMDSGPLREQVREIAEVILQHKDKPSGKYFIYLLSLLRGQPITQVLGILKEQSLEDFDSFAVNTKWIDQLKTGLATKKEICGILCLRDQYLNWLNEKYPNDPLISDLPVDEKEMANFEEDGNISDLHGQPGMDFEKSENMLICDGRAGEKFLKQVERQDEKNDNEIDKVREEKEKSKLGLPAGRIGIGNDFDYQPKSDHSESQKDFTGKERGEVKNEFFKFANEVYKLQHPLSDYVLRRYVETLLQRKKENKSVCMSMNEISTLLKQLRKQGEDAYAKDEEAEEITRMDSLNWALLLSEAAKKFTRREVWGFWKAVGMMEEDSLKEKNGADDARKKPIQDNRENIFGSERETNEIDEQNNYKKLAANLKGGNKIDSIRIIDRRSRNVGRNSRDENHGEGIILEGEEENEENEEIKIYDSLDGNSQAMGDELILNESSGLNWQSGQKSPWLGKKVSLSVSSSESEKPRRRYTVSWTDLNFDDKIKDMLENGHNSGQPAHHVDQDKLSLTEENGNLDWGSGEIEIVDLNGFSQELEEEEDGEEDETINFDDNYGESEEYSKSGKNQEDECEVPEDEDIDQLVPAINVTRTPFSRVDLFSPFQTTALFQGNSSSSPTHHLTTFN